MIGMGRLLQIGYISLPIQGGDRNAHSPLRNEVTAVSIGP
jgi:hypothetical protein